MGTVYGGRWETLRSIGRGGQSEVFQAFDVHAPDAGLFALKRVTNPIQLNWFFDEAEALSRIDHPNVIKLIEFCALTNATDGKLVYIVMPQAKGGDLPMRVAQLKLNLAATLAVAKQIAAGLVAAHKAKVVHRDLKPSNVLFAGAGDEVWLTDFGTCLLLNPDAAKNSEGAATLFKMTEADEIHALGMMIYYMISGGRRVLPRDAAEKAAEAEAFQHANCAALTGFLFEQVICPPERRLRTVAEVAKALDQLQ